MKVRLSTYLFTLAGHQNCGSIANRMKFIRELFAVRSPKRVCIRTYELFLEGLMNDEVCERLCKEGFAESCAARAVTFMPSAFARVHYDKQGIGFPSRFYPGRKALKKRRMFFYAEEPIFQEAMRLAEQLKRDGDWPQVWRFIEISAEHSCITKAIAQGLTPKEIEMLIHEF